MFKNFLKSKKEYRACEKFWESLCGRILEQAGQDDWQDWLNKCIGDGTPFAEGDPMHSLVCRRRRRAIKIQQWEKIGSVRKLWAEIRVFDEGGEFETTYLELRCVLTKETASIAEQLFSEWVKEQTTEKRMQILIRRLTGQRKGQ